MRVLRREWIEWPAAHLRKEYRQWCVELREAVADVVEETTQLFPEGCLFGRSGPCVIEFGECSCEEPSSGVEEGLLGCGYVESNRVGEGDHGFRADDEA